MTHSTPEKMTAKRKGFFALTALLFGGGLLATGLYLSSPSNQNDKAELVFFTGLPDGTTGDVRVETASGNRSFMIDAATPHIKQGEQTLVPPYRVYATLKFPGDRYRDFTLAVDKSRHFSVVLDGLEAWDPVSLTIAAQPRLQRVPADWSGKLQLDAALPAALSARACVEINSGTGTLVLCHDVGEVRAS